MLNYQQKSGMLYWYQHGKCPVCKQSLKYGWDYTDLHHKMRNTKGNRRRYPKLIDSILNLEMVHHNCHIDKHGSCGKMSDLEALAYETLLNNHPLINKWANGEVNRLYC